ncbi:MAG: 30S ribosomal protein S6 [Planctomycetes bacterium]|nr:30S ribosomal protein S6 [Planctomycetota bacterium]
MPTYEGMFLVDPTVAQREWPKVVEELERVVKKNGASVVQISKWGERKLAFPVRKCARGTYVLVYVDAPEQAVGKIRADFQLSEVVLRSLILRHEGPLRQEPSRDFETAGPVPPKRELLGGGVPREASAGHR